MYIVIELENLNQEQLACSSKMSSKIKFAGP